MISLNRIVIIDATWAQFRLTVGAPDAEAKFRQALKEETTVGSNIATYPVIYVWSSLFHTFL